MRRLISDFAPLHYELKDELKEPANQTEAVQKPKRRLISLSISISPAVSVIKCNERDSPLSTLTCTGVLLPLAHRRAK